MMAGRRNSRTYCRRPLDNGGGSRACSAAANLCGLNTNIDAEHLKVNYSGFKSKAGIQWKPTATTMLAMTE